MQTTRYKYGNQPKLLPIKNTGYYDEMDNDIIAAGFDAEDEEVTVCALTEDWNGHPKDSIVVTGLTVSGHPFAVLNRKRQNHRATNH